MKPAENTQGMHRQMDRITPHWERPEREIYVDKLTVAYEGYLDIDQYRAVLIDWCKKHDYIWDELVHKELVSEHGKDVAMKWLIQKRLREDYYTVIKMEAHFDHVTEKTFTVDRRKMTLQHAHAHVTFNGFLASFLRYGWESKNWVLFIKTVIDKFVYKFDRGKYPGIVVVETKDLANKTRGFFENCTHRLQGTPEFEKEKEHISKQATMYHKG